MQAPITTLAAKASQELCLCKSRHSLQVKSAQVTQGQIRTQDKTAAVKAARTAAYQQCAVLHATNCGVAEVKQCIAGILNYASLQKVAVGLFAHHRTELPTATLASRTLAATRHSSALLHELLQVDKP